MIKEQDRPEPADDDWLRRKIDETFADPRPDVPARAVFRRLREYHEQQVSRERHERRRRPS